jgi:catechol 2,3-dioxygenase-like lactoylglutathione lyase family enzyme
MPPHQLSSVTIGVPAPDSVAPFYTDFGLKDEGNGAFSTVEGGRQLFLEQAPTRRLIELVVGVDDREDLARANDALVAAGHRPDVEHRRLSVVEPNTGVRVVLETKPRGTQAPAASEVYNGPGRPERPGQRSSALSRPDSVRPRKLGHVVVTTTNLAASSAFFGDLMGFKVSDYIGDVGVFLRCSTDHHNLLLLDAPIVYLHHTAWEVDDIDEVGRGASAMLDGNPERHVWGPGRHHAGSNFFWYLRDPAGNYSEYYADLDYIPEGAAWNPQSHEGHLGLYNWGPPPPASFLTPDDLMEIASARSANA